MVDEDSPDWCVHYGDGTPKSQCSRCNGLEQRRAAEQVVVVHWFEARYDGHLVCGCHCNAGDLIGRRADDEFVCEDHGQ